MTKIKVSEASGPVLDWMVAKCEGVQFVVENGEVISYLTSDEKDEAGIDYMAKAFRKHCYSTDPAQGFPIIEREEIGTKRRMPCMKGEEWEASGSISAKGAGYRHAVGPTPLIAAMRAFVVSKLGEIVEVPDELI